MEGRLLAFIEGSLQQLWGMLIKGTLGRMCNSRRFLPLLSESQLFISQQEHKFK